MSASGCQPCGERTLLLYLKASVPTPGTIQLSALYLSTATGRTLMAFNIPYPQRLLMVLVGHLYLEQASDPLAITL